MKKDTENKELVVTSKPLVLTANFDVVEKHLKSELKKYDVVVTEDTLKDCKKLSTELNAIANNINAKRKEEVALISVPIKAFDEKIKSLVTLCQDGREKLTKQIKVFEDKTKADIKIMLLNYLHEKYDASQVESEYRTSTIDDLVILGNRTATGKLAGKATSAIDMRVMENINTQNMVATRLLKLENASYKAGLKAPLERIHIAAFLMADDEVYDKNLESLLKSEVNRQEVAEEKTRAEVKKETPVTTNPAANPDIVPEAIADMMNEVDENKEPAITQQPPEGKTLHVIQARFEVMALPNVKPEQIVNKLKEVMEEAGITSLVEINLVNSYVNKQ